MRENDEEQEKNKRWTRPVIRGMFSLRSTAANEAQSGVSVSVSPLPMPAQRDIAMRTLIISYDLAHPHLNKHVLAQQIMALGEAWARPLDQTWYVRTDVREESVEAKLSGLLESDDGLLIQAVEDSAVLTNTALRWFRRRRPALDIVEGSNVIAFPVPASEPDEQPELPLAEAC
jgi:hypothetical protein